MLIEEVKSHTCKLCSYFAFTELADELADLHLEPVHGVSRSLLSTCAVEVFDKLLEWLREILGLYVEPRLELEG